jgi:hypothetical protein
MALSVTAGGTGASNTSSSTLAFNCGLTVAAGDLIVVVVGADNNGSSGARSISSITTAVGNVFPWTRTATTTVENWIINALSDPGAAAAGATLTIATSIATASMSTTDQITVNFSPATTAKAAHAYKVSGLTSGKVWDFSFGANAASNAAATANPTQTTAASVAVGDITFGGVGAESSGAVTGDSDTTNGSWSSAVTTQSGGTMLVTSQYKIQATAASTQTYNITLASSDHARGVLIVGERDPRWNAPTVRAMRAAAVAGNAW